VPKSLVVPLFFDAAKSFLDIDSTMANDGERKTGIDKLVDCWCDVFSDIREKHPKMIENGVKITWPFLDLMADTSGELQNIENPKPGMEHFHNVFQALKTKHHEYAQANPGKMLPRKGKDHSIQVNGRFFVKQTIQDMTRQNLAAWKSGKLVTTNENAEAPNGNENEELTSINKDPTTPQALLNVVLHEVAGSELSQKWNDSLVSPDGARRPLAFGEEYGDFDSDFDSSLFDVSLLYGLDVVFDGDASVANEVAPENESEEPAPKRSKLDSL